MQGRRLGGCAQVALPADDLTRRCSMKARASKRGWNERQSILSSSSLPVASGGLVGESVVGRLPTDEMLSHIKV